MSAWSVKTRRAPFRHYRDARVQLSYKYGHAWHGLNLNRLVCNPSGGVSWLHHLGVTLLWAFPGNSDLCYAVLQTRVRPTCHAAFKADYQPFNRSNSQLTCWLYTSIHCNRYWGVSCLRRFVELLLGRFLGRGERDWAKGGCSPAAEVRHARRRLRRPREC